MKYLMQLIILATMMFVFVTEANAEWYRLSWVNPTEREDNTVYNHVTEGDSTDILHADTGDVYKTLMPDITVYEENFPNGCYKMALTATDNKGRESTYSNLVEWCAESAPKSLLNVVVERIPAPSQ